MEGITLTFGDQAENHVGMEKIGNLRKKGEGFQFDDLMRIWSSLEEKEIWSQIYTLSNDPVLPDAHILVITNGVNALLSGKTQMDMFEEQKAFEYDKKAFMYGRVVSKHARWNVCFDEHHREPNYEKGMGTIIGYDEVPIMSQLLEKMQETFGEKARDLKGEANYYYSEKTGIGFHGDSERRIVIAARIGHRSTPLHFQWYHKGEPIGDRFAIPLNPGDIYIMSEKAVGTDWKMKNIPTLRHATGHDKYLDYR